MYYVWHNPFLPNGPDTGISRAIGSLFCPFGGLGRLKSLIVEIFETINVAEMNCGRIE